MPVNNRVTLHIYPAIAILLAFNCSASLAQGFYPERCVIASKPSKCLVNSFGVKKNPKNNIEINHPGGIVGIKLQGAGAREGAKVLVNNTAGTIQLTHTSQGSSAITIVTQDGKVYSFSYGD